MDGTKMRSATSLILLKMSLTLATVVLEQTSPAHPCPSDQVNLTCTLPGNLLIWTVPDMMEADHSLSLAVFCNTQLPMTGGSYQSVLVGCSHDGSSITSTLVFNIFQTVHIKCWNGTHHSQAELTVPLELHVPPPLLLLDNSIQEAANENNRIVSVLWELPFETNIDRLLLQFSPFVPECGHNCSLARDTGSLTAGQMSVTLEVGTRYEVVARAESCGGDLSSPWSDPLTIHLQAPSAIQHCRTVPTYNSGGQLELITVTWPPTGVTTTVFGYTVNYTTDTQPIEQTVSLSSCGRQCRRTLSGDEVSSDITTVTVWAWNTFGRGEETLCNKNTIKTVNNIAEMSVESSTDSKTTIKLQWQEQVSVLLNQITVICSTTSSYDELVICNQTVAIGDGVAIIEVEGLQPSTTYYYKVEVAGDKPFALLGVFSTMAADDTSEKGDSISLEIIIAAVSSLGGVMLGVCITTFICFCLVCRVWKNKKSTTEDEIDLPPSRNKITCSTAEKGMPHGVEAVERVQDNDYVDFGFSNPTINILPPAPSDGDKDHHENKKQRQPSRSNSQRSEHAAQGVQYEQELQQEWSLKGSRKKRSSLKRKQKLLTLEYEPSNSLCQSSSLLSPVPKTEQNALTIMEYVEEPSSPHFALFVDQDAGTRD